MASRREMPGVETPWISINQLLNSHERFHLYPSAEEPFFLFAPKSPSKLSALLYLLKEEKICFCSDLLQDCSREKKYQVLLSVRALSEIAIHEEGWVEVGAGCQLAHLQSRLFEAGYELGVDTLFFSQTVSIGSFILQGPPSGIVLNQRRFSDCLFQVETVRPDGGITKWGKDLPYAGGMNFSTLIWGIRDLQSIPIKFTFKLFPQPQRRLYLAWSFYQQTAIWCHLDRLKAFTSTWERLDAVFSGHSGERGFVLAQVSGTEEEMKAFKNSCPDFDLAEQESKMALLKAFFNQQKLSFYPAGRMDRNNLQTGYMWYHSLTDEAWVIYSKETEFSVLNEQKDSLLWKQRFLASMEGC